MDPYLFSTLDERTKIRFLNSLIPSRKVEHHTLKKPMVDYLTSLVILSTSTTCASQRPYSWIDTSPYIKCLESRRKMIRAVGLIVVIMNIPTGPSHLLFLDYNYEYSNWTKPLTILKFSVWVARSAEFVDRKSI